MMKKEKKHLNSANYSCDIEKEIVHPFELEPPSEITQKHIFLLKQWKLVNVSNLDAIQFIIPNSIIDSIGASIGSAFIKAIKDSIGNHVEKLVCNSIPVPFTSVLHNELEYFELDWVSPRASVSNVVYAYIGSFFKIGKRKEIKYRYAGYNEGKYLFQSAVDLWEVGLVPSFDKRKWRLHGGEEGKILFEIGEEDLEEYRRQNNDMPNV